MKLTTKDKKAIANAQRVSEALQKQREKPEETKINLTRLAQELSERREQSVKDENK